MFHISRISSICNIPGTHSGLLLFSSYDVDGMPFPDDNAPVLHSTVEWFHQGHAPAPPGVAELLPRRQLLRRWHECVSDVELSRLLPGTLSPINQSILSHLVAALARSVHRSVLDAYSWTGICIQYQKVTPKSPCAKLIAQITKTPAPPVPFLQIAKLSMIPVSCLLEVVFDNVRYSRDVKLSIGVVLLGVGITTISDVSVNFKGFVAAAIAVWSTALQQYVSPTVLAYCTFYLKHDDTNEARFRMLLEDGDNVRILGL